VYLLDTNCCIDFLTGRSDALAQRMRATLGQIAISTITLAELAVGNRRSIDPKGDAQRVQSFAASLRVLPFDADAARVYGAAVRTIGVRRNTFDRLIGAHALAVGLILVTANERDFIDIPGLVVENWTG